MYWFSKKRYERPCTMATDPTQGTNGLTQSGRFDRIAFDPQIMGGRACVRGMRITVSVIIGHIAHGADFEEVLKEYPDLEREDIEQALAYTAWLAHEEVHPA